MGVASVPLELVVPVVALREAELQTPAALGVAVIVTGSAFTGDPALVTTALTLEVAAGFDVTVDGVAVTTTPEVIPVKYPKTSTTRSTGDPELRLYTSAEPAVVPAVSAWVKLATGAELAGQFTSEAVGAVVTPVG